MGPKKTSGSSKVGGAGSQGERLGQSGTKKALEKLFRSLSQEERDALLHVSEEEGELEEADEETDDGAEKPAFRTADLKKSWPSKTRRFSDEDTDVEVDAGGEEDPRGAAAGDEADEPELAEVVEEAKMSGGRRSSILSSGGRTIDCMAQDLKVLGRPPNLDKHNLDVVQAARKELDRIGEFAVVSAAGDTIANNRFFKLPSGARFSDLMDGGLSADVAFWDARLARQEAKLQHELEDDW
ncbi:predicted protein [Histoplasma mississippiense (nom. inval.)]|uniref:predicted protein n=1 Tax=Ajellomyces capsulatus (strain NAm1 / WU24) TaxID=2059318 RepID=UPI000157CA0C|nr:predicted protein [Histoplasma mississippiense (nom. inval.)]EDN09497.1 predicted protein [Histoplasma mississippiense (nom. inval.)]